MIPVREKTTTTEHSRPAFSALERIPLIDEVSAAQQQDPAVTLEIEKWREICAKDPRSDREEDFAQKHKLDDQGFWKKHPTLGTWSLRVPASVEHRVL